MEYHVIYSMGRDCASAMYLRDAGLRITSGPLDWLTNVGFEPRVDLICNGFRSFMNLEDFRKLSVIPGAFVDEKCDSYENVRTGFHHLHDFEVGVPISESFDDVKKTYDRRIARFLDYLKSDKRVLLVWLSHIPTKDDELLLTCCNRIIRQYGNHIDFLLIEHDEELSMEEVIETKLSDNVTRISLYSKSKDEQGRYTTKGREEYIAPIFERFSISGIAEIRRTRKIRRFIGRLLTIFVPIRKYRKIIRRAIDD